MSFDERDVITHLLEIKSVLGELKANNANVLSYTKSVSENLGKHIDSEDPHPKSKRANGASNIAYIGAATGFGAILIQIWEWGKNIGKHP